MFTTKTQPTFTLLEDAAERRETPHRNYNDSDENTRPWPNHCTSTFLFAVTLLHTIVAMAKKMLLRITFCTFFFFLRLIPWRANAHFLAPQSSQRVRLATEYNWSFETFHTGVSVCLQVIRKGEVSCCWTCTPCKENEFVFDEYTCRACDLGSWPTDDLTGNHFASLSLTHSVCCLFHANANVFSLRPSGCEPIPVQYVRWGDPEPIAAVVFSCLGLMATLFVTSVFIK